MSDELKAKEQEVALRRDTVKAAEAEVDKQLEILKKTRADELRISLVTKEAAALAALTARAGYERQHLFAAELGILSTQMILSVASSAVALHRTDESTARLADRTGGLVWATWALAMGTFLLVVATGFLVWAELTHPPEIIPVTAPAVPPVIVVPQPPPSPPPSPR